MFSKATFFLAFVAIAKLSSAAVPGCLLGAINQYEDPADIKAVCQSKDAQTKIQKFCGDGTSDALSAFADVCNKAGVKVSTVVSSGSVSATGSATGSVKPSGTGASTLVVATGTGPAATGAGAAATGTGAPATGTTTGGPAESTGAAGKLEVGVAALFAGFGLLAAAL